MGLKANTPLLAVDIGSNSIKLAQLKGSPRKYELMNMNIIPLDPAAVIDGVIRDEDAVAEALSKGLKKQKNLIPYAVSSVAVGGVSFVVVVSNRRFSSDSTRGTKPRLLRLVTLWRPPNTACSRIRKFNSSIRVGGMGRTFDA